jgi:ketosteroid isomerase-like protein
MPVQLPPAIASYIATSNAFDANGATACFAPDAVVRDEGHERKGPSEIRAWKAMTAEKYRPTMQVLDAVENGGKTVVRCRVSGDFPGSPVELRYAFMLAGGKIASLEIIP